MTRGFAIAAAGVSACVLAATTSYAQPSESVNVDVADCLELETREQQLDCYESRVKDTLRTREEQGRSGQPAAAAPNRSGSSPSTPQRASSLYGDPESDIVAKITRLREMEPNAYMIYLDNGQIWRQNRPRRYPLNVDDEVRLYPTKWGTSYRLTDPDAGGFIQVERVQ